MCFSKLHIEGRHGYQFKGGRSELNASLALSDGIKNIHKWFIMHSAAKFCIYRIA